MTLVLNLSGHFNVARRSSAQRTVLEFAIKTRYVLDSWKTSWWPWIFSGVLENSWIFFKFLIKNCWFNVNEQINVQICSILNSCVVKSKLLQKRCVVIIRFIHFSISYLFNLAWLAHTWFNLSESSTPYSVACRGGGEHGDCPGHPKQSGIQRVKLQKLKCCSKMIFPVVRLLTDAAWI